MRATAIVAVLLVSGAAAAEGLKISEAEFNTYVSLFNAKALSEARRMYAGTDATRKVQAEADYKKAVGHPKGVAELSLFYCEEAVGLLSWCGMDDESYYAALARMFDQELQHAPPDAGAAAFGQYRHAADLDVIAHQVLVLEQDEKA